MLNKLQVYAMSKKIVLAPPQVALLMHMHSLGHCAEVHKGRAILLKLVLVCLSLQSPLHLVLIMCLILTDLHQDLLLLARLT